MAKSFGKALRQLRQEQGMGLRMAADELGLSPAYLSRIEQDKESPPRPEIIRKIATLLGGGDHIFALAKTMDPDLTGYLQNNPTAMDFLRTAINKGFADKDFQQLINQIEMQQPHERSVHSPKRISRKEEHMRVQTGWPTIWSKIRENLRNEPRCPRHSNCPHVKSMVQGVINDILSIETTEIVVRSHRTNNVDTIPEERFKTWWEHLKMHGSASLTPGGKNNPHPWRSRIVGAILASALPEEIEADGSNSISLKGK
ncbi:MAG: helix-turn-helix transcriptional regulator [Nitrospirota bacterium]